MTNAGDIMDLVGELVGMTYRPRGAALYLLQGRWAAWALGTVEGQWDGSADAER